MSIGGLSLGKNEQTKLERWSYHLVLGVTKIVLLRINMVIKDLDLEPKIDTMMRDFLHFAILPDNIEVSGSHVPEVFVSHYEQFLGTSVECNELNVEGLFSKSIPATTSSNMVCDITNDEIKAAMFDIGDDKAPGPGGFTSAFFKKGWSVVGHDVSTPLKVNNYRPISCCNVIYICISKILSNRIIEGIKEVVSDNQAAFKSGRRISDNILITQELMHSYHRNHGPPRCAFIVDIQKAYDMVDWRFLETILVRFGFHCTMVKWIMACVASTPFSLNINGNIHGFFKGKRGLRQGDPLSPYLFTMVMEILTLILKRRVHMSDSFLFYKHCEELEIINVCFADDLFIFARGELASARVILESLDEFKMVSGLVPSIPKSMAYFCNVVHHVKLAILNIMPFSEGELPLIRGFLWCNGEFKWGKAKFAWDDICLPKEDGGVGLRCLDVFNIALMTTHIWNIDGMSWGWLKFLQLWDIVRPFFWVKLAPDLELIPDHVLDLSRPDVRQWCDNNGSFSVFSVAKAWEALRPRGIHDRMRQWDVGVGIELNLLRCALCDSQQDSHAHLFFECPFLSKVKQSPEDIRDVIMVTVRLKLLTFRFKDT
ncbi:protein LAZ1 [Tanacetum coccineum]